MQLRASSLSLLQANNGWLKAIAKLPALQTLVLRGCNKVGPYVNFSRSKSTVFMAACALDPHFREEFMKSS